MVRRAASSAEWQNALSEGARNGQAVIVDFTAAWCGPCQKIAPVFEELAREFSWAIFVKVDVDENQDVAAECGVRAMPTFQVFKDMKQVEQMVGADTAGLRKLVEKHAGDKWQGAGEGHLLGNEADGLPTRESTMSEREKRLAALERRGL